MPQETHSDTQKSGDFHSTTECFNQKASLDSKEKKLSECQNFKFLWEQV